jgi:hypothetical protein
MKYLILLLALNASAQVDFKYGTLNYGSISLSGGGGAENLWISQTYEEYLPYLAAVDCQMLKVTTTKHVTKVVLRGHAVNARGVTIQFWTGPTRTAGSQIGVTSSSVTWATGADASYTNTFATPVELTTDCYMHVIDDGGGNELYIQQGDEPGGVRYENTTYAVYHAGTLYSSGETDYYMLIFTND